MRVELSTNGKANFPIVIGPGADPMVRAAAARLKRYLDQITGAAFEVREYYSREGVYVGLDELAEREDQFFVCTYTGVGMNILGATPEAAEMGVSYVLLRAGCLFPPSLEEYVPSKPTLALNIEGIVRTPSFRSPRMVYDSSTWAGKPREDMAAWCKANMIFGQDWKPPLELGQGNTYLAMINRSPGVFKEHPGWRSLIDGQRIGESFCLSNPDLRTWAVAESLRYRTKIKSQGVYLEPPDNPKSQCQCANCVVRPTGWWAYHLLNELAAAMPDDGYAVMAAYSFHATPPPFDLHPRVWLAFPDGYTMPPEYATLEDWIAAFKARGMKHFSAIKYGQVYRWGQDSIAKGCDTAGTVAQMKRLRALGAESLAVVISPSAAYALTNYVTAWLMFDIKADPVAIQDDFLRKMFGPAAGVMGVFYDRIEQASQPLLTTGELHLMYSDLDAALNLVKVPAQRRRLLDLVLFVRYQDLLLQYQRATPPTKPAVLGCLLMYVYEIRNRGVAHGWAAWRSLPGIPPECDPLKYTETSDPPNPWMESHEYSEPEIRAILSEGLLFNLPNRPPVALPSTAKSINGNACTCVMQGSDPDGDPLTYRIETYPTHGQFYGDIGVSPKVNYRPNPGYHGTDTFTFSVSDGRLRSEPATMTITI